MQNFLIKFKSFFPGELSTPDETSTALHPEVLIAPGRLETSLRRWECGRQPGVISSGRGLTQTPPPVRLYPT